MNIVAGPQRTHLPGAGPRYLLAGLPSTAAAPRLEHKSIQKVSGIPSIFPTTNYIWGFDVLFLGSPIACMLRRKKAAQSGPQRQVLCRPPGKACFLSLSLAPLSCHGAVTLCLPRSAFGSRLLFLLPPRGRSVMMPTDNCDTSQEPPASKVPPRPPHNH